MQISMVIEIKWNRRKESLTDFSKKYQSFKQHIFRLQALGHLPRESVEFRPSIVKNYEMPASRQLCLPAPVVELSGEYLDD